MKSHSKLYVPSVNPFLIRGPIHVPLLTGPCNHFENHNNNAPSSFPTIILIEHETELGRRDRDDTPRVVVDHPSTASNSSKSGAISVATAGEKRRSPDAADGGPPSLPLSKSPRLQLQEVAVQTELREQPTVARRRRSRPTSRGIRFGNSEYVTRRATSEEPKSSQAADGTTERRAKSEEKKKKSAEEMERGWFGLSFVSFVRLRSQAPHALNKNLLWCTAECREEQRKRRMEEKPWRANMKKAAPKREDRGEREEKTGDGEEDDGEEDELAKRPWRNNMRATTTRSGEGRRSVLPGTVPILKDRRRLSVPPQRRTELVQRFKKEFPITKQHTHQKAILCTFPNFSRDRHECRRQSETAVGGGDEGYPEVHGRKEKGGPGGRVEEATGGGGEEGGHQNEASCARKEEAGRICKLHEKISEYVCTQVRAWGLGRSSLQCRVISEGQGSRSEKGEGGE